MNNLRLCYASGQGGERDLEEALRWHRRAAEAGGEAATASLRAPIAAERSGDWAHRLAEGLDRVAWVDPLPIPGDWKGLAGAEAEVLLAPLKRHLELAECRGDLEGLYVQRLRRARLGFYRDSMLLLDLQLRRHGKVTPVLVSALVTPTWTSLLNGGSPVIDAANRYWLALDSDQAAEAYLRFLCTFVHGEEGPFQMIDDIADLPMDDAEQAALSAEVRQPIRPPRRLDGDPDTEGSRRFAACVLSGRGLFLATFKVWSTGVIDMERAHQLAADSTAPRSADC